MKKTIGIIGGEGQMGTFFRTILKKHAKVLISDIDTDLSNGELVKQSDIVIISVPINITTKIIESIIPFTKRNQLLCDLTSIKSEPTKIMKKSASGVVGLHPMFGPGVKTLIQQKIIACPIRKNSNWTFLKEIFEKEGAIIKITDPEKHDKMMGIIQGMKHFSSITMSYALKELNIDVMESLEFTSPIYRLEMDMVGRILNQNPELYAEIEFNVDTKIIESYLKVQNELLKIIKSKDMKKFTKYFNEASDHLGDFKKQAEEESNYLINQLVTK